MEKKIEDPKDVLLLVLHFSREGKIMGKTVLMKLMFIITEEIFPQAFDRLEYYPWKYGPYSEVLLKIIEEAEREGLIIRGTEKKAYMTGDKQKEECVVTYKLSEDGREKAKELLSKITDEEVKMLEDRINSLLQKRREGIVSYVYRRYPAYTILSEAKNG